MEVLNKGGNAKYTSYHTVDKLLTYFRLGLSNSLTSPASKLRQPLDTHWLACDEAVQTLKRSLGQRHWRI